MVGLPPIWQRLAIPKGFEMGILKGIRPGRPTKKAPMVEGLS